MCKYVLDTHNVNKHSQAVYWAVQRIQRIHEQRILCFNIPSSGIFVTQWLLPNQLDAVTIASRVHQSSIYELKDSHPFAWKYPHRSSSQHSLLDVHFSKAKASNSSHTMVLPVRPRARRAVRPVDHPVHNRRARFSFNHIARNKKYNNRCRIYNRLLSVHFNGQLAPHYRYMRLVNVITGCYFGRFARHTPASDIQIQNTTIARWIVIGTFYNLGWDENTALQTMIEEYYIFIGAPQ